MAPLIITMVRHGESRDNVTALWAGHRDAPLTNHGYNQSMRLAKHFEDVPITAIYASDLNRAQTTARNVLSLNKSDPKPPLTISPLLREQFFGEAEGAPWNEGLYSSTHLPWEDHRSFQLAPFAESLNDVSKRADKVLRYFVLPHLIASSSQEDDEKGQHIMLFAHGIWLSEMRFALMRAQDPESKYIKSSGYTNTGWARFELELIDPDEKIESVKEELPNGKEVDAVPKGAKIEQAPTTATSPRPTKKKKTSNEGDAQVMSETARSLLPTLPELPERDAKLPPLYPEDRPLPRMRMKVLATNQAEHLEGLTRTKGGVGSGAWDEKQKGLKEFFGGGGKA